MLKRALEKGGDRKRIKRWLKRGMKEAMIVAVCDGASLYVMVLVCMCKLNWRYAWLADAPPMPTLYR